MRAARASERERDVRRRNQPTNQPRGEITAARSYDAARDESNKTQSRKEQHERPEFARADATERPVGARGQQWKHDQRHDAEPHRCPQRDIVDARDHRVQTRFLDEHETEERDDAASETKRSESCEHARCHDNECSDFRCCVDILPAGRRICCDDDGRRAGEQHDGCRLLALRQQPSARGPIPPRAS